MKCHSLKKLQGLKGEEKVQHTAARRLYVSKRSFQATKASTNLQYCITTWCIHSRLQECSPDSICLTFFRSIGLQQEETNKTTIIIIKPVCLHQNISQWLLLSAKNFSFSSASGILLQFATVSLFVSNTGNASTVQTLLDVEEIDEMNALSATLTGKRQAAG